MIALQRGDKLPTVAIVQALLNTRIEKSIAVDGVFGPITEKTVRQFQISTHCSNPTGRVDSATWSRLKRGIDFSVVDVIDICDPDLLIDLKEINSYNKNPLVLGCMSNAVEQIINQIRFGNQPGSVVLVRFDGHGAMGVQSLGMGRGRADILGTNIPKKLTQEQKKIVYDVAVYSAISSSKKGMRFIKDILARLRPVFSPYGSIEFHGCKIANGLDGRNFINEVSLIMGVPVTASLSSQPYGTVRRFVGPTYSAFPSGTQLHDWSVNLPIITMSLP